MRRRVFICLGLLLALFVIGAATALWCLHRSTNQLSALAESHHIQVLRTDLAASGVRLERDLLAFRAGHDRAPVLHQNSVQRFQRAVDRCTGCHHAPGVKEQLVEIRRTFDAYVATTERLANGSVSAEDREQQATALVHRLVLDTTMMADQSYIHLQIRGNEASASIRRAWQVLCQTLILTTVFGGLVAFHLRRRITRPLEALLADIKRVRDGEKPMRMDIDADEEFRALDEAFNDAYENLTTAQDRILQAEKMAAVGKLAAGVAHEVGNPLASISSVAQIMRRRCHDDDQAEKLDLIMQHVNRVSRIVRELLTFSRPNLDNTQGQVEVGGLLDRAVSLLRYDQRVGCAVIDCRYEPGLCLERADPDRLLTVFTNVMINAFDALSVNRNGDARLVINARDDGDRIIITFTDNGPGMTKDEIHNAFEPFFTTKEPGCGTGLGLWVCYQVIEKHGGTIRVESSYGEGVCVVIELPKFAIA